MYFRCLGSTQHLKNKYGSGYVLVVKCVLEEEDWKKVEDDIFEIFVENKTMLDESFADRRIYSVLQDAVKSLGDVFAALEKCKKNHWLHICYIFATYFLHICCISAAYLLHICCIFAAYFLYYCCIFALHLLHICSVFALYLLCICSIFAAYLLHICWIFAQYLLHICSIFAAT